MKKIINTTIVNVSFLTYDYENNRIKEEVEEITIYKKISQIHLNALLGKLNNEKKADKFIINNQKVEKREYTIDRKIFENLPFKLVE